MDGAGLMAMAAVVALAACGNAAADGSGSGSAAAPPPPPAVWKKLRITPPEGWVRMPNVEAAAAAAAAKMPSAVTMIEAWGDPGAGCYAVAVDSRGKNVESIAASVQRFAAGLAALGVDAKALPPPVKEIIDVPLTIKTGELTGTVRVRMFRGADARPQAVALACAGNAREPERCTTQCQALQLELAPPEAP
jgi:hypothetical protein